MADVWRDTGDGKVEYVPTEDGVFEAWMDEHEPKWNMTENSQTIVWWREIWEAARQRYGEVSD